MNGWILIGSKQIEIQATTTSDIRNDEKKTSIVYVWIGISITERQRAVTQRFEYQLNKRIIHLLSQFKIQINDLPWVIFCRHTRKMEEILYA